MANHARTWKFWDIEYDVEVTVPNLKKFCEENNLNYSSMHQLGTDETGEKEYQGYRVSPNQDTTTKAKNTKPMTLYNVGLKKKTGHMNSRAALSKQSGISSQSIWRLMVGKAVNVRGWALTFDDNEAIAAIAVKSNANEIDLAGEDDI